MAKESSFEGREIKEYDFKNPEGMVRGKLSDLQLVFETFVNLAKTTLSGQFRATVEMEVAEVGMATFGEFLNGLSPRSILSVVNLNPWEKKNIFQIEAAIASDFIERMLGGKGGTSKNFEHEPTEIELSVNKKIVKSLLRDLVLSFKDAVALEPEVLHVESNPKRVQILPDSEMVVLCKIRAKIGEIEGLIVFCLPMVNLEKAMEKLALKNATAPSDKKISKEESEKMRKGLAEVKIPVITELGEIALSVKELLGLGKQDVIRLNVKPSDELILKIGEHAKFKCRPGISRKRMAVQVSKVL